MLSRTAPAGLSGSQPLSAFTGLPASPGLPPPTSLPASPVQSPRFGVPTPFTQAIQLAPSGQLPTPTLLQSSSPGLPPPTQNPRSTSPSPIPMQTGVLSTPLGSPIMASGSPSIGLDSPQPRTPTDEDMDELSEHYLAEMGDAQQLASFFYRYSDHDGLSQKCYLNGRYFWKVMAPYTGLVGSELYIRVNALEMAKDPENGVIRNFEISDPIMDLQEFEEAKTSPTRYRIIKAILDIADNRDDNTGAVHTNLIYLDTKTKEVIRFEPMYDENFTEPLNTVLKAYFEKIVPGYSYRMLDDHPQLPMTDSCPSKGMCSAYVLKKAMMLVTGLDRPLNGPPREEELKIMRFADAIETEYGPLDEDEGVEAGFSLGFSTGPTVAYPPPPGYGYGGPQLYLGTGFYPPPYYGYVWGPRFGRRHGWGWGRHRHRIWGWGSDRTEYGKWDDLKTKLNASYNKAKMKVTRSGTSKMTKEEETNRRFEEDLNRSKSKVQKVMGLEPYRMEYGCGCMGCRTAPPRGEYGYWQRDEYGNGQWKPVAYGGAKLDGAYGGASYHKGFGVSGRPADPSQISREGRYLGSKGDVGYSRPEFGCGCMKPPSSPRSEYGLDPRTWSPQAKTAGAGAVIGLGAGALFGGWKGAVIGGLAGGAGGYLLGSAANDRRRYDYPPPPRYY